MTPDPTSEDRFETALAALLQLAYDNDVDVEGGWKCTIDGNGEDHWDVQIAAVDYDD